MVKKSQNLVNTVWTTPYTILVTGSNDLFVNYDSLVSKGVFDEKVEIQYVNNKYRIKLDLTNQICIKNLFYTFVIGCCILWARFSIWITYWLLLTPDGLFTLSQDTCPFYQCWTILCCVSPQYIFHDFLLLIVPGPQLWFDSLCNRKLLNH